MNTLREASFAVIGIFLFASVYEIILPDGNMKKYTSLLLGILAAGAIISSLSQIGGIETAAKKISAETSSEAWIDIRDKQIEEEYKNNIRMLVKMHGGNVRSIEIDNEMNVTEIILEKGCESGAEKFITEEMGVPRNAVKIK